MIAIVDNLITDHFERGGVDLHLVVDLDLTLLDSSPVGLAIVLSFYSKKYFYLILKLKNLTDQFHRVKQEQKWCL